jgi:hypothetical protein
MALKQLTIRGFDEPLERALRELARELGVSLNRAAIALLKRGAGLSEPSPTENVVGSSLDSFIGVWSAEDETELLEALEPLEQIDPEHWS